LLTACQNFFLCPPAHALRHHLQPTSGSNALDATRRRRFDFDLLQRRTDQVSTSSVIIV
jgi:hypothetical protein